MTDFERERAIYFTPKIVARFFRMVEKTDTCWIWKGSKIRGYGNFLPLNKKNFRAHRWSFEYYNGQINVKSVICHSCDNPSCVNPIHLWQGTQADNMRDCASKKRNVSQKKTHCPSGHEYTEENTIKYNRKEGWGVRRCRICKKLSEQKRRLQRKLNNADLINQTK